MIWDFRPLWSSLIHVTESMRSNRTHFFWELEHSKSRLQTSWTLQEAARTPKKTELQTWRLYQDLFIVNLATQFLAAWMSQFCSSCRKLAHVLSISKVTFSDYGWLLYLAVFFSVVRLGFVVSPALCERVTVRCLAMLDGKLWSWSWTMLKT